MALLAVDALDELSSGAPSVAAAAIRSELGFAYGNLSLLLLAVPLLTGLVLEPPLLLWAAARDRDRCIAYALGLQAAGLALAASATGPWALVAAVSAAQLATSIACELAQARLIALHPEEPERILVRWTFFGALGDISTPALFALIERLHAGWRTAFACCSLACACHALLLWRAARSRRRQDSESFVQRSDLSKTRGWPLSAAWHIVRERPVLWLWTCATLLCALLDEIFLTFAALHMRERSHFDAAATDLTLFAMALGTALGIAATDRLLTRYAPRVMLAVSCSVCTLSYLAWLQLDEPLGCASALFVVGVAVGPQFPIAQAQAYRWAREDPLLVGVLDSVLAPVNVALPWLLGLLAEHAGLGWTLALLLLQPIGLLAALLAPTPPTGASRATR